MQRSKFDIGRAEAGAGGMSISSGSGGASGTGASSSSSDASAVAQSTGSSGAGSGSMCLEKSSSRGMECGGLCDGFFEVGIAVARKRRHPVVHALFFSQRSVTERAAHSAEDCRHQALFTSTSSNEPSRTERARVALTLRLDAALEAAEYGHVAGLQVRRVLRGGRQHSTTCGKAAFMAARVASLGVDAGHVPREGSTIVLRCPGSARSPTWL